MFLDTETSTNGYRMHRIQEFENDRSSIRSNEPVNERAARLDKRFAEGPRQL
jgi:hypothetical protein